MIELACYMSVSEKYIYIFFAEFLELAKKKNETNISSIRTDRTGQFIKVLIIKVLVNLLIN